MRLSILLLRLVNFSPKLQLKFRVIYRSLFIKRTRPKFLSDLAPSSEFNLALSKSKSQIFQDVFVLNALNYKQNGFFIDIGSTDGKSISNTYILEKYFDWSGLLVEPNKYWIESLKKNRKSSICTDAVFSKSNMTLKFIDSYFPELSSLDHDSLEIYSFPKLIRETHQVNTISILDLFIKYLVPKEIDYLSIDIEGLEFQVLKDFDFNLYNIKIITCEHNSSKNKELISELLTNNGYKETFIHESNFESWYLKL